MDQRSKSGKLIRFFLRANRGWFSFMLRFFPSRFRDEFQEEMQGVFDASIKAEARKGLRALFIVSLWEWVSLPINIFQEIHHQYKGRLALPATAPIPRPLLPATHREAVLAGLPHLAFCLFVGRLAFIEDINGNLLYSLLLGIPLLTGFLAAAFHAWRAGWPRWSASWYGYWLWIWVAAFANGAVWLNEKLHLFVDWQFTIALLVFIFLLLVLGVFCLFRYDPIRGLLAVFFLMPVGLPMTFMEFVPDRIEGWLALGSGLVAALCAAWILHDGGWRRGIWLALGGNSLIGIAYSYVQVFKLDPPLPELHLVNPPDFFIHLFNFVLVSAILIAGPFLFWGVWDARRPRMAG